MELEQYLSRQRQFSLRAFGPGTETLGVIEHVRQELREMSNNKHDIKEWADVVILGFDGMMRSLDFHHFPEPMIPKVAASTVIAKLEKNERREWPDWRTVDRTKPINHMESKAEFLEDLVARIRDCETEIRSIQAGLKDVGMEKSFTKSLDCLRDIALELSREESRIEDRAGEE